MNKLQKEVDKLINEFGGYWRPFEMLAAVIEELGELSDEMLKFEKVKGEGSIEKLEEEFGDLMFALFCIANYYGIDVERALLSSIAKYRSRDKLRWQ
ncbi:MazG nucleotide pyrophosphohydrolase domain-containing protein [Thermococcus paralvinellae]|uniref:Nucleotide pyrophosphohydrolase n=1 Tax=Thermococcus paralvinellae TaxID=582419 RepID=W0I1R8_9EURY|nr:MazG nucleotide pyrophosphohydrolase domain-containing protein [Thermococcus paralvinellae]AHF79976.1 nucleotide pyrophosphohydrolase [Thermococcus paralvinellae]